MSSRAARGRSERRIVLAIAALVLGLEAAATLALDGGDAGLRALLRATARTSLVWFALAFAARPLVARWPTPASKWLLRNRRALGLAMAISHGGHLVAIAVLAARVGAPFWAAIATTTLVGGGLGYVLLGAMVATSFDRSAAWLGRRRWRALHLTGMWSCWVIFTATYAGQVSRSAPAAVAVAALLAVAALRVIAWRGRRVAEAGAP